MTELLLDQPSVESGEDNFVLPVEGAVSSTEDYFSSTGHRRLALEMLIDAVTVIKKDPDSKESQYERRWLLGVESNCPISAPMCFEAVAGCDIDVGDVSRNFLYVLQSNPDTLLNALTTVRKKIDNGDFDITDSYLVEMPDYSLAIPFDYRQRSAG